MIMKKNFFDKFNKCVLPGRDPKSDLTSSVIFGVLWVVIINVVKFYPKFEGILKVLYNTDPRTENYYQYWSDVAKCDGGNYMPPFGTLIAFSMTGAVIYIVYRIIKAIYDMGYFRRYTNSIYVIKRLDEPAPVFKRCWTVALVGIGAALISVLIMCGIDYLVYTIFTPEEFMLPEGAVPVYRTY